MKRLLNLAWVLTTLNVSSSQATPIHVSGISCQGGELTLVTGNAFNARCAGDLRLDAFTAIQAEASIYLSALGNVVIEGHLSARQIIVIAGAAVILSEGGVLLFNGNGIAYGDPLRSAGAILSIDGVDTRLDPRITVGRVALPPNSPSVRAPAGSITAVPQPATALLLMIGGAAMIWLRHPRRLRRWAMSRLAQGT